MSANDNEAPPVVRRSGSQKRRRRHSLQIALDDTELARVKESAARTGLAPSSYGRAALLGTPGPRAQRTPPVNGVELAKATAALNKVGGLLNQMARILNTAGATSTGNECYAALAETRAAAARIREIVGRKDRA